MLVVIPLERADGTVRVEVNRPDGVLEVFGWRSHGGWTFYGRMHGERFVPSEKGEAITPEYMRVLNEARVTGQPVSFPDPYLDNLSIQGV